MHPTGGTVTADGAPINLMPAKVLDFGISLSQVGDGTRQPLTSPGAILGTPKYMAPEHVLGNVATASGDLFAMGAILYEMLAGAAAFDADSVLLGQGAAGGSPMRRRPCGL